MNMVMRTFFSKFFTFHFVINNQKHPRNFHALVTNYTHRDYVQPFILSKNDYLILNIFQRISNLD